MASMRYGAIILIVPPAMEKAKGESDQGNAFASRVTNRYVVLSIVSV